MSNTPTGLCETEADLQANASAADLSETRFFDAWGLQASSWQGLAGQDANVVKGPAVVLLEN